VYIDVGANDPSIASVTRGFYDHGWSGIAIEPNPAYAASFRVERPRDIVVEAVAADLDDAEIILHMIDGTGLSTIVDEIGAEHVELGWTVNDVVVPVRRLDDIIESAGLAGNDIHFISIDTEGAEASVLRSLDLTRYRPWVLVVEATAPLSTTRTHHEWEPPLISSGYTFCLFDGLSRFYVANERRAELAEGLDHPAGIFDAFTTVSDLETRDRIHSLDAEVSLLRESLRTQTDRANNAIAELERMRKTVSWHMTGPLRSIRGMMRGESKR
jgi:FkbM family methyltransferase